MVLYADGTSLIISERTRNDYEFRRGSMNVLENWFKVNNLLHNIDETQFKNFKKKCDAEIYEFEYKDKILKSSKSVSSLGGYNS